MTQRKNMENKILKIMRAYYNSDLEQLEQLIKILLNNISHTQLYLLEQDIYHLEKETECS